MNIGPLELRDNNGKALEYARQSYFGRITYNYKNRYLLQGISGTMDHQDLQKRTGGAFSFRVCSGLFLKKTLCAIPHLFFPVKASCVLWHIG